MAQGSSLRQADQQWLQSYHTMQISPKWTALLDGGFRWRNGFTEPSQYVIRPAIGYNIHPDWQVRLGWTHLGFFSDRQLKRLEFRPYLELAGKQDIGKQTLKHRFRWEHRSFHPAGNLDWWLPEQRYSRLRYGITWLIPIHQWTAGEQTRQFILGLGDEFSDQCRDGQARAVYLIRIES